MRHLLVLIVLLTTFAGPSVAGSKDTRSGTAKDCYLFDDMGVDGLARVSFEFRLVFLKHQQPETDSQFSDASGHKRTTTDGVNQEDARCLVWTETTKEPEIEPQTAVKGRKVIRAIYRESENDLGGTVLLAMETAKGSGWFAPFFMAKPEIFEGAQVSTRDIEAGYITTIRWSGTGAMRSHYVFALHGKQPVFLVTRSNSGCHRSNYSSDEAYEKAYEQWLKYCDEEDALTKGVLPRKAKSRTAK